MTLETFATRSIIAITAAASAWLFFYQPPGAERSSFSHSGTQVYNRVIR
jgi:hypothetical protein|tara:strand:+ start:617 stop:763 length:147 start_codon:yes stop_codon:yes gene_type:complete